VDSEMAYSKLTCCYLIGKDGSKEGNNEAREVINKAKVEDDEYKTTTEEHTYYRYIFIGCLYC
jgi:predicted transcriptional regulator